MNYLPFSGGARRSRAILAAKSPQAFPAAANTKARSRPASFARIGVTSAQRMPGIDIPTFKEQGIDLVIANWRSVVAPPGITPHSARP